MSKQVPLAAHARAGSGKSEARSLRRQGRVPAIAYGSDLEPTPLSVDARDLYHALRTEAGTNAILELGWEESTQLAIARQIQRHPVRREILHVDFVTVDAKTKVNVDVPLHVLGEAKGVSEGGVLDQPLYTINVDVLPLEVPSEITVDVTDLDIGDVIRVGEITLPEGVETTLDPDEPAVSIVAPTDEPEEPEIDEDAMADTVVEGEEPEEGAEAEADEADEASEES